MDVLAEHENTHAQYTHTKTYIQRDRNVTHTQLRNLLVGPTDMYILLW